jgi:hypothetical protein
MAFCWYGLSMFWRMRTYLPFGHSLMEASTVPAVASSSANVIVLPATIRSQMQKHKSCFYEFSSDYDNLTTEDIDIANLARAWAILTLEKDDDALLGSALARMFSICLRTPDLNLSSIRHLMLEERRLLIEEKRSDAQDASSSHS